MRKTIQIARTTCTEHYIFSSKLSNRLFLTEYLSWTSCRHSWGKCVKFNKACRLGVASPIITTWEGNSICGKGGCFTSSLPSSKNQSLFLLVVRLKMSLMHQLLVHHNLTSAIVLSLSLHWSPFGVVATLSLLPHIVLSSAATGFGLLVLSFLLIAFCTIGSCVNFSESGSSLNEAWWSLMLSSSSSNALFTVPTKWETILSDLSIS